MGSFGALYYGAQLNPQAIIVGQPLVNIGTIEQYCDYFNQKISHAEHPGVLNEGDTSTT